MRQNRKIFLRQDNIYNIKHPICIVCMTRLRNIGLWIT